MQIYLSKSQETRQWYLAQKMPDLKSYKAILEEQYRKKIRNLYVIVNDVNAVENAKNKILTRCPLHTV